MGIPAVLRPGPWFSGRPIAAADPRRPLDGIPADRDAVQRHISAEDEQPAPLGRRRVVPGGRFDMPARDGQVFEFNGDPRPLDLRNPVRPARGRVDGGGGRPGADNRQGFAWHGAVAVCDRQRPKGRVGQRVVARIQIDGVGGINVGVGGENIPPQSLPAAGQMKDGRNGPIFERVQGERETTSRDRRHEH